jgi:hypothetical protein
MSHVPHWISKLVLILALSGTAGCALIEDRATPPTYYGPRDQVYYANFEEVWRAVNLVLQPYPLRVSNMDQGVLETDEIKGNRVFSAVYKGGEAGAGESYRITIRVIKGQLGSRAATKVTVVKDAQIKVDFFSDPRNIPTDGVEAKTLLYRIGREIQIERALAKAQKKQNAKQ